MHQLLTHFQHGDIFKVISMNPSGLWRGMTETDGRVGHFKFINVEMIPQQRSNERKRSDRRKRSNASSKGVTSYTNKKTDHKKYLSIDRNNIKLEIINDTNLNQIKERIKGKSQQIYKTFFRRIFHLIQLF